MAYVLTLRVYTSDWSCKLAMFADRLLLVGVTLNLFSSSSSSLSFALSSRSFAIAALQFTTKMVAGESRAKVEGVVLRTLLPLLDKELLRFCKHTMLTFAKCSSSCSITQSVCQCPAGLQCPDHVHRLIRHDTASNRHSPSAGIATQTHSCKTQLVTAGRH